MKKLLALLIFTFATVAAQAQGGNAVVISFSGAPTGSCGTFKFAIDNTTGDFYDCFAGSWLKISIGATAGTVTHTVGALTSNAVIKGNGSADLQASGVTIDSSNNVSTAGTITAGSGASTAGEVEFTQGTTNGVPGTANTIGLQAPTAVTSYVVTLPGTAGTGLLHLANSSNTVTGSISAVALGGADVSGTLLVANGGTGVTAAQGNGSKVQLSTGSATSGKCVEFDANGNTVVAVSNAACGSGGGTTLTSWVTPGASSGSGLGPTGANQVRIVGINVPATVSYTSMSYRKITADNSNPSDVGLYDSTGALLCHSGAFTNATTGLVTFTCSGGGTKTLTPGKYYFAVTSSAATVRVDMGSSANLSYCSNATAAEASSSGVLPNNITIPADSWVQGNYGFWGVF